MEAKARDQVGVAESLNIQSRGELRGLGMPGFCISQLFVTVTTMHDENDLKEGRSISDQGF